MRSVSPVTTLDVERLDAQHLGDEQRQHVVGALPDLGGAAERGHAARAVELELHARVRQLVPVDRQPRAAQVRRAGQAEPAAARPACRGARASPSPRPPSRCTRAGRWCRPACQFAVSEFGCTSCWRRRSAGIDAELHGDLVELHLLPEAGLRGAVAALGAARRLVGEGAAAAEAVARDVVGDRLQRAGVERARPRRSCRRRRRRAASRGPSRRCVPSRLTPVRSRISTGWRPRWQ